MGKRGTDMDENKSIRTSGDYRGDENGRYPPVIACEDKNPPRVKELDKHGDDSGHSFLYGD